MNTDMGPGQVMATFWKWAGVGVFGLAVVTGLIIGGWQLGWWFQAQNATRQAQNTQNGYSNQSTLRQQVTAQLATVETITTQRAAAGTDQSVTAALRAQRMGIASIVCADAAQISGTPLPAEQAQWVSVNCSAGTVSPSSSFYQAGQP